MGIISTTAIVHSVRASLRITCDQYVIADTIDQLNLRRKSTTVYDLSMHLGMSQQDVEFACMFLVGYELIICKGDQFKCTHKWTSSFFDNTWFDNPLPKFASTPPPDYRPGFWQVYNRRGSSKPLTLKRYLQAIKTVDPEDLLQAAKAYIDSVSDPVYVMYSEKFLNPDKKYYESWLPVKQQEPGFGTPTLATQKDMSGMI